MIITLTGFMGCGKSSIGSRLARQLGWEFIDLDTYIEHKTGLSIPEIFKEGEEHFRLIETEALRDVIVLHQVSGDDLVLSLGGGTIMTPVARELILRDTVSVFLRTSLETIKARISGKPGRPLFNEESASELYCRREPVYSQASMTVDTEGRSPDDVASLIARAVLQK